MNLKVLPDEMLESIHESTLKLLEDTGLVIGNSSAKELLQNAGCQVDEKGVRIPASLVTDSIAKAPKSFSLYSREGSNPVTVGKGTVFNPGSSAANIRGLDGNTRKGILSDVKDLVCVVEHLDNLQAQSTALVPSDVPAATADYVRLFVTLVYSSKPIVTGGFTKSGLLRMLEMLAIDSGSSKSLARHPRAIFDCCPLSPLTWGDVACQNLIDCSSASVPVQIVPAPLMGATSPITLGSTLVQANAEVLSGVVISQLVSAGSPVIYGGAPGIMDMRTAAPAFSSMETIIIACASSEVGHKYSLPTHTYLGSSDSHLIDAQAGFEAGLALGIAAASGINVVSGPGMLSSLNCQSLEKLVIDNEFCAAALRLAKGLIVDDIQEAPTLLGRIGIGGDFLGSKHTRHNLRISQLMPSTIINRMSKSKWMEEGATDMEQRAAEAVSHILNQNHEPLLEDSTVGDMIHCMKKEKESQTAMRAIQSALKL